MATAYSQDLRDRVLSAYERGMKTSEIARTFEVSPAWARRVKQRFMEHGERAARKVGSPGVRKFDRDQLVALVEANPDATLLELRDMLGVDCSAAAISKALIDLGFTYKKRRFTRPSRIAPMSPRSEPTGLTGQQRPMRDV